MLGWGVGLAAAVVVAWAVLAYNRLVDLQQRSRSAWGDVDAQLKRRHDLVPALVETVKGYAAHERSTLEEVVERRGTARRAADAEAEGTDRARAENGLVGALRHLFALGEAYPELRASERFGTLQQQLAEIENELQHARRYYNAVVRDLNTAVASFPTLLVARPLGFRPGEFFEVDSPLERHAVRVDLGGMT